ncbi:MAG TPA: Rne/Rng family ribonuclease [Thermoanaerobaculia bacterium]
MTRRMLINARSPEEVRLAIVSDKTLDDYQLEVADRSLLRGNIYRGTIASIQPSLNAAFIDYGGERHGFLSARALVPEAYYRDPADPRHPKIDEVLERGRPIVVQVARESEGDKGAVLTTDLSLAGRYLVFTPFSDTRGVSRKVEDEDERNDLKEAARGLDVPDGGGVIVRTNALGQTKATLQRDLAALLRLWKRVSQEAREGRGTRLLYSDQDLIFKALRDYLDATIAEIVVDDPDAYARADEALESFMPRSRPNLVRYEERAPLFSRFGIEEQIANVYDRRVQLPSGGSLVIDRTEALTAIDVNSGRATSASSHEETVVQTNLEAAAEVARQLRLRDIGGLIVIDFIDMRASKNQRKVEKALRDAMKPDKARFTVGRISPNGLLEVNRQRLRQALSVRTHQACPTCTGTGRIPSPEMVGLALLRQIEARAASGPLGRVRIELHPEYADALQNSRRREIARLEGDLGLRIEIIASPSLHRAEQAVEWLEGTPAPDAGRGREAPEPSVRASQLGATKDEGGKGRGQGTSKGRGRGTGRPKEAVEAAGGEEKEAARGGGKGRGRGRGRKRRGSGRGAGAGKGGGGEG